MKPPSEDRNGRTVWGKAYFNSARNFIDAAEERAKSRAEDCEVQRLVLAWAWKSRLNNAQIKTLLAMRGINRSRDQIRYILKVAESEAIAVMQSAPKRAPNERMIVL